eukprot:ANDGO_07442.mRNA.1 hypothetical protein
MFDWRGDLTKDVSEYVWNVLRKKQEFMKAMANAVFKLQKQDKGNTSDLAEVIPLSEWVLMAYLSDSEIPTVVDAVAAASHSIDLPWVHWVTAINGRLNSCKLIDAHMFDYVMRSFSITDMKTKTQWVDVGVPAINTMANLGFAIRPEMLAEWIAAAPGRWEKPDEILKSHALMKLLCKGIEGETEENSTGPIMVEKLETLPYSRNQWVSVGSEELLGSIASLYEYWTESEGRVFAFADAVLEGALMNSPYRTRDNLLESERKISMDKVRHFCTVFHDVIDFTPEICRLALDFQPELTEFLYSSSEADFGPMSELIKHAPPDHLMCVYKHDSAMRAFKIEPYRLVFALLREDPDDNRYWHECNTYHNDRKCNYTSCRTWRSSAGIAKLDEVLNVFGFSKDKRIYGEDMER